jgi:hypothetical protein
LHRFIAFEVRGHGDGEVLLWLVVLRGRRRELGVEGARIEDRPEFVRWIRAGSSTLQHPNRKPNADFGVNEVLSVCVLFQC